MLLKYKNYCLIFVFVTIYLSLHFFFLSSDANIKYSKDSGNYTDEALYTFQIKEYCNSLGFDSSQKEIFSATPLYQLISLIWFKITYPSLEMIRVLMILFSMLTFLLILKIIGINLINLLIISNCAFLYQVFSNNHHGLVYPMGVFFIVFGIYFYHKYFTKEKNKYLFFTSLALFSSLLVSLQFVLIPLILPLSFILTIIIDIIFKNRINFKPLIHSFIYTSILYSLYLIVHVFPNYKVFENILNNSTIMPNTLLKLKTVIISNIEVHLLNGQLYVFLSIFPIIILLIWIFKKKFSTINLYLFAPIIFWILLELPRLGMYYMPYRYLLSLFIGITFLYAIFFSIIINRIQILKFCFIPLLLFFLSFEFKSIFEDINERKFKILELRNYIATNTNKNDVVIGNWGIPIAWDAKIKCIPLWKNYMNDYENLISKIKPRLIITEKDEIDSDCVFKSRNIDLNSISDSITYNNIGSYKLIFYWISKY